MTTPSPRPQISKKEDKEWWKMFLPQMNSNCFMPGHTISSLPIRSKYASWEHTKSQTVVLHNLTYRLQFSTRSIWETKLTKKYISKKSIIVLDRNAFLLPKLSWFQDGQQKPQNTSNKLSWGLPKLIFVQTPKTYEIYFAWLFSTCCVAFRRTHYMGFVQISIGIEFQLSTLVLFHFFI